MRKQNSTLSISLLYKLPVSSHRYQCDQCPYRCHRMDQLNSHKLRHQAKSLICEICAYACKRKYELRNHMLAKHSGEGKRSSVYKCKYCTYTTFYRQALQNHENCKHTKLKEFRCALCFYSSFSSISLFLHKRKAHGYVPGDKAWLENYAAKEKERNSTGFLQDFYNKPSVGKEPSKQSTGETPPSQTEQSDLPGSAEETGSQDVGSVDVFDVCKEVAGENPSVIPSSGKSPEYCTLVLTTLSSTAYETPSFQNEVQNPPSTSALICKQSDASQEKGDFPISACSSEEDNTPRADEECEESDLDDNCKSQNNTNVTVESEKCQTEPPELHKDPGTISSSLPPEKNQLLESEIRLKAMKKHDKDQSEAMFLEGRVQMLVVPSEDIYRCDKCSYVTRKEITLKHHCRSLCHGRIQGHKCQTCGALFKQRRGLESHLAKRCPALPRKTFSAPCLATEENSTEGHGGAEQLEGQRSSDQTKLDQECHQQEEDGCTSHLTNCKDLVQSTSGDLEHQQSNSQMEKLLKINQGNTLLSNSKQTVQKKTLYSEEDGRFNCTLCDFSAVKLATVKRHISTCQKVRRKKENQILSEEDDECGSRSVEEKEDRVKEFNRGPEKVTENCPTFSCPSCAFKCNQRRLLDRHEKRGCLDPDEVQCTMCSFVAGSKTSLTHHIQHVHDDKKSGVSKLKRFTCQYCSFTCKQERRLDQHIALKHKGVRPHSCRYCPFSTTRRYRLDEHESLHTGIGRHSCDMCNKTFGALTKLRQHKMRIHDKQPTHLCSLCDFSSYTLDDVRRHKLRCHTGELHRACTHCEARFSSEVALRNHCKRAHQLQVCFLCKQCDYTCSTEVALKTHQQSKHSQVKCTTCQESFETKEGLDVHRKIHLAHHCQLCPFATKTRQLLAQHLLSDHEDGSPLDKPLKCSSCQFACQHQLVLEQHLRSHGGKRLYKCTDCKYSTRNKQKITWHIRIHTGEKPYSCEQCRYTCTDPSRLKVNSYSVCYL